MNTSKESIGEILSYGDDYLKLRDTMEADLRKSGFNPKTSPPCEEPDISRGVSCLSKDELRDLYDKYLAFYDYISDDITRLEIYLRTTDKRASVVQSRLLIEAAKMKKELTNAELRSAWVEIHPAYQAALKDALYFKQMHAAQEQRLKKMSKAMDKVYWALWNRDQPHPDERGSGDRTSAVFADRVSFSKDGGRPKSLFKRIGSRAE